MTATWSGNSTYSTTRHSKNKYCSFPHPLSFAGASGDKEGETPCVVNVLPPSVTCDADFGYGLWTAVDANTATWRWVHR